MLKSRKCWMKYSKFDSFVFQLFVLVFASTCTLSSWKKSPLFVSQWNETQFYSHLWLCECLFMYASGWANEKPSTIMTCIFNNIWRWRCTKTGRSSTIDPKQQTGDVESNLNLLWNHKIHNERFDLASSIPTKRFNIFVNLLHFLSLSIPWIQLSLSSHENWTKCDHVEENCGHFSHSTFRNSSLRSIYCFVFTVLLWRWPIEGRIVRIFRSSRSKQNCTNTNRIWKQFWNEWWKKTNSEREQRKSIHKFTHKKFERANGKIYPRGDFHLRIQINVCKCLCHCRLCALSSKLISVEQTKRHKKQNRK